MTGAILRRIIESIIVLLGVAIVVFIIGEVIGDPARLMLPIDASQAAYEAFRAEHGFDRPIWIRFFEYLGNVVTLNFGDSLRSGVDATSLVLKAFVPTFLLALATQLVAVVIAVPVGTIAGMRPNSFANRLTSMLSILSISVPTFWVGMITISIFAVTLGWLPTSGYGAPIYYVLPTFALALGVTGRLAEVVRASVQEQMTSQYVKTARAKGVSERRIVFGHVLRNAMGPALTVGGDEFASLIGGATVIEVLFGWPGIGFLTVGAIAERDLPVVQASVIITAIAIVILNAIIDASYGAIDPRVRRRK